MKFEALIVIMSLAGCANNEPLVERELIAADYRCAAKQMKRVKRECEDASPSWQSYCEDEAKSRYCGRVEK